VRSAWKSIDLLNAAGVPYLVNQMAAGDVPDPATEGDGIAPSHLPQMPPHPRV